MPFIPQILTFLEASKYTLLFIGTFIEGSVVMMGGGLLLRLEQVTFWPLYSVLVIADVSADLCWYALGYFGARKFVVRWGHIAGITPEILPKIESRFHRYHTWILVISKLTMGFGLAAGILLTAGIMRISLLRFTVINTLGSLVWVLFLIVVGYYFGNLLELIPSQYQIVFGLGMLAVVFIFLRYLTKRLARVEW